MKKLIATLAVLLGTLGALFGAAAGPAHASNESDFLGCLANHSVVVKDRTTAVDLEYKIQADLVTGISVSTIVTNLMGYHHIPYSDAQVYVGCAGAALLMNGH